MASFRILVLSDLHMHQGVPTEGASPSYLSSRPDFAGPKVNPLRDATELMKKLRAKIDWIVCPGDISDKNDIISARLACSGLEELKRRVHARKLIGTVGNHDVDSRREDAQQHPDDSLRNLQPRFPSTDERFFTRFWTNHYVIWKDKKADATLVVLNSCVLHGLAVPPNADPEHKRGYITEQILNNLSAELPTRLSNINILLMHHHIRQHPWLAGDESHAVNGPQLIERLRDTGVPWFVIHGHLHLPNLSYPDAGERAPIILSAGSLAAKTFPVRGHTPRNQMYLIEFSYADAPRIQGK